MADVATTATAPAFKKRANKSSNLRKRPATPPPQSSDSDSTSDEDDKDPGTNGPRIKRAKKEGILTTTSTNSSTGLQDLSKSTIYTADRTTQISSTDDATRTLNSYNPDPRTSKHNPSDPETVPGGRGGIYKGASNYGSFISKSADAQARSIGPVKATGSNVRMVTTTDFAPDVCKDYKQTGFCGFGDNCKFLHAREDYAQGWQLDREWEKAGGGGKGKKNGGGVVEGEDDEEKMLEKIPFACILCKESYKNPVVTKCGHYFCEKCAMTRYMKEKKPQCAACGADTNGTFQVARKLKGLLEKKKLRMAERAQEDEAEQDEG